MMGLFDRFIPEKHHLVVEEEDLVRVLKVIQSSHRIVPEMTVGNCGWADDASKWFIHFGTTRYTWKKLIQELKIVRAFNNNSIPKNTVGLVYTTD